MFFLICVSMITPQKIPFPAQPDIFLEVVRSKGYEQEVYFFAPHENEHVVNDYLREKVTHSKGFFAILRQAGKRNIGLNIEGQVIQVDPNRIFTPRGCRGSISNLNPNISNDGQLFESAWRRAVDLGRFVLNQFGPISRKTSFVAIHNNLDGYDDDGKNGSGTVSMNRYEMKLENGAKYIKKLHLSGDDEDDLFFVTKKRDYKIMKRAGWNVLLQHPQVAKLADEDDGSLSVFAEMIGCRYINIEAQRKTDEPRTVTVDHLDVHKKMVDFVYDLLLTQ